MTGSHEDQTDWLEEARKEGQALHDAMLGEAGRLAERLQAEEDAEEMEADDADYQAQREEWHKANRGFIP